MSVPGDCGIALHQCARTIITKFHRLGGLNKSFLFFQFWRLEDQDQGICRLDFSWGLSLWLVDGFLFSVFMRPSFCACVCPTHLLSATSHGLGQTQMASFYYLITSLNTVSLTIVIFWGSDFNIWILGGTKFSTLEGKNRMGKTIDLKKIRDTKGYFRQTWAQ